MPFGPFVEIRRTPLGPSAENPRTQLGSVAGQQRTRFYRNIIFGRNSNTRARFPPRNYFISKRFLIHSYYTAGPSDRSSAPYRRRLKADGPAYNNTIDFVYYIIIIITNLPTERSVPIYMHNIITLQPAVYTIRVGFRKQTARVQTGAERHERTFTRRERGRESSSCKFRARDTRPYILIDPSPPPRALVAALAGDR